MRPQDVLDARFRRAPWYRLGLDAADVRAYLSRVADALVLRDHVERVLRTEIARLRAENERIKVGLNRWQAEQRWSTDQRRHAEHRWNADQRRHAEHQWDPDQRRHAEHQWSQDQRWDADRRSHADQRSPG
jgi:DivIVA domain-containing protein